MSISKPIEPNCVAYLRDGYKSEFRSAVLEIVKEQKGRRPSGALSPRKAARAYTAVFQHGLPELLARGFLYRITNYLGKDRPPKVEAIAISIKDGTVEMLSGHTLRIDAAPDHQIRQLDQLNTPSSLPWRVVVIFGSGRHWKDAIDDVHSLARSIKSRGLLRGYASAPWGSLELTEKYGRGIYAEIRRSNADEDDYGETYFEDDEEDDEDEDDESCEEVLKKWEKERK